MIKFLQMSWAGERRETQVGAGGEAGRAGSAAGTVAGIVCAFALSVFFVEEWTGKSWDFSRELVVMKERALQEKSFINSTANRAVCFCFQECFWNQT